MAAGEVGAWFITLGIHAAVFSGVLIIFGYFRRHPLFRKFYAAKRYAINSTTRKPDKLDNSLFQWTKRLLQYNETDIAEIGGMDALMYLRLQYFGVELLGFITLMTMLIIIPVNISGGVITDAIIRNQPPPGPPPGEAPPPPPPPPLPPAPSGEFENTTYSCEYDVFIPPQASLSQLDRVTMSNIPMGSGLLWAHLFVCVVIVFYTLHLVFKYNLRCVAARLAYLGSVEPGAEANTVLVQDIPGMQTGSFLDRAMRLAQGPLSIITPHKFSVALEEKVAKSFGVGLGLKIPRTKAARLRQEAEAEAQKAAAEEAERAGPSRSGESKDLVFLTPRKTSTLHGEAAAETKEGDPSTSEPVNLPEVVVMLDGKEVHHDEASSEPPEPEDDFDDAESVPDVEAQPKMLSEVREITDLKALEKDLMAFGRAREMLEGKSVEELVLAYFQEIYGEDVACVNVIPSQKALFPILNSYKSTYQTLDDLLNVYLQQLKRRQQIKLKSVIVFPPLYGSWATSRFGTKKVKVEAIVWHVARLDKMREEIASGQLEADVTAEPAAFVTFKSRVAQTIASTALQDHDTSAWTVGPAPGPDELVWTNIGMRAWLRSFRSLVVNTAYVALVFFYGAPVALAQGYLNQSLFPILPPVLQALLPGIVLTIFLAILPTILGFLALIRGAQSQSRVQWEMVERYFPFQVVVVFVFQLFGQLAANLIEFAKSIATKPEIIFQLLAAYAPQQSFFFTSYVLVKGLSGRTIQLINPGPLVMYWLKSSTAVTPQAKSRVLDSIFFQYGTYIPYDTMTLLLGLTFAVQNPLVPFVCFLYFCTGYFVGRYNLLYVYSEQFQSGGAVWPTVVNQIFTALLIFEVFMSGMFSLYDAGPQGIIMLLLIPITVVVWRNLALAFNRPQRVMSMTAAAKMDRDQGKLDWHPEQFQRVYTPPVMRDISAEHEELVELAQSVLDRLKPNKAYAEFDGLKEIPEPVPSASTSNMSYHPPSVGASSMDASMYMDARESSFKSFTSAKNMQTVAPEHTADPDTNKSTRTDGSAVPTAQAEAPKDASHSAQPSFPDNTSGADTGNSSESPNSSQELLGAKKLEGVKKED